MIAHRADVPILLAAQNAGAGYLITLNRKHLIDDRKVAERSGQRIGRPDDSSVWVRSKITGG